MYEENIKEKKHITTTNFMNKNLASKAKETTYEKGSSKAKEVE